MSKKIAVIGSGGWGTAAAVHLNKLGHEVTLWSWLKEESDNLKNTLENKPFLPGVALPSDIIFTSDIGCVKDKDLVVLVTPSKAIRSTARSMASYVSKDTVVVILSKGIEDKTLKTLQKLKDFAIV